MIKVENNWRDGQPQVTMQCLCHLF